MASPASCFLLWRGKQTRLSSLSFSHSHARSLAPTGNATQTGLSGISIAAVVLGCRGDRGGRKGGGGRTRTMLCCRVVLSCPSGGGRWGGDELESSGAGILVGGRWSSSGIRVSGCSGCLAGRWLVGSVRSVAVAGWVEGWSVCSPVCSLHPAPCRPRYICSRTGGRSRRDGE